jgi:hypothetical protein
MSLNCYGCELAKIQNRDGDITCGAKQEYIPASQAEVGICSHFERRYQDEG